MRRLLRLAPASLRLAVLLCLPFMPHLARAQGLLVVIDPAQHVRLPRPILPPQPSPPPATYAIKEIAAHARLTDNVAQVEVSQTFVNTGSSPLEVAFVFPLPADAAVDRLTFLVDGHELAGKLLSATEARAAYEAIVRKNRDPALLEWLGTGMFQTSVFPVPPGQSRAVSLRYAQVCRSDRGLTDFLFPLSTAKYTAAPVSKVLVELALESSQPLKNIYSPSHTVEIKRSDEHHATVRWSAENIVPQSDFRLMYDLGSGAVGTSVLSYRPDAKDDGYLLLLASPQLPTADAAPAAKTVVFVVDRSGSMSGEKIEQAKSALRFVLNNLREGDLFNVVAYDSEVVSFRPELQRFDDASRAAALGFVEGLYAGGSTNIDGALRAALGQLQDSSRPNFVIFLTDGLPTAGETGEAQIVANAKSANQVRARVFSFGVGYDVNSRLLDKLVRANFGTSEYVRPQEDIETHVARLYQRIGSPVLTDVQIAFEHDGLTAAEGQPVNRVYPSQVFDLFAGEQLVVAGRYRKAGAVKVVLSGTIHGAQQRFEFPATLVEQSGDESQAFVEKIWAARRIGEIIDQLDLQGKNEELIKELVELSTRHGILTPYTSFLADESTALEDVSANASTARYHLRSLEEAAGEGGFSQRAAKLGLQNAAAAPASGEARFFAAERDEAVAVQAVRNIGAKSFFQRGGRWIDSTASETQQQQAQRVVQFSDEYFALAASHGRTLSQYLVFDEPVVLNLAGQVYLIEPPTAP
ncbi:MAG: VIT and VWA domain-containing protein [Pirellulales bacterium]|nr:VIT and VWA domain-containing protein [Pirellulales bacterium]